jgi:hypothetical protein
MTKIIEIEVNYCNDCKSHVEICLSYFCHHDKFIGCHGKGDTKIQDFPEIPSWCPLPDKED